ncbi:MAG: hypothetical protein ACP5VS_08250 [Desulfomonilaceae bacterium]
MGFSKTCSLFLAILIIILTEGHIGFTDQVWTKCHITCRCLQDNSVGNFSFVIPVDRTADIGYDADLACKTYGHKICADGCNGLKFSYTYQVTSP